MKTRDITLIAQQVAILVASQIALSSVVGVNLVFPLLIIYTFTLGFKRTMLILIAFVSVRFLIGLPILTVFLWTWTFTVLIVLSYLVSKITKDNEYIIAFFTFIYFVLFGFLCAVQENLLTEVPVIVYWIRGVPTDILGGISGFVTMVLLYHPIKKVVEASSHTNDLEPYFLSKKQVQD